MTSSLAAIHVAKKQLGLDDDTYRAKLNLITGKASTKDMSEAERQKVLTVFRNEGFQAAPAQRRAGGSAKLSGPYAKKLQALWIAGWNLGVFRSREDAPLVAFVKRQTELDAVRFLRYADDAHKAIEALKAWIAREGGVIWSNTGLPENLKDCFGYKIASAQWAMIGPKADFWPVVTSLVLKEKSCRNLIDREWIIVMNELGKTIRAGKRKALTS